MLQNYFTVALRKLFKHRDYALLNVLGLGLSVGCGILVFMLIRHHSSFDTYHKNADRIVRVVMDIKADTKFPFAGAPTPMSKALREECAFVEKTAMRSAEYQVLISVPQTGAAADKYQEEEKFAWVEPEYLDILDLPLLRGNPQSLNEPNTVLITEKLAHKYFGEQEAVGKTIRLNNEFNLQVVGILNNLPKNTDYKQEILASWATLKASPRGKDLDSWAGARGENYCFALLQKGHTLSEMEPVMAAFREKHPHPSDKEIFQYKAMNMLGLHFDTDYGNGIDDKFLWALGFIGLFLLVTACVNFVNMATAQALTRAREVGVRKSLGSTRGQLFWQFMLETSIIVSVSLLVGFLLSWLALPYLNAWLDIELEFNKPVVTALAGFIPLMGIVLTFLAGFYPGLMQARFNAIISMKGSVDNAKAGVFVLRKVLVATQFMISQVLIISAVVVTSQMRYAQNTDWGFRPGTVLTLEIPENAKGNSLKQQISQIAGVKSVSLCFQPPASTSNNQTAIKFDNRPESEKWFVNDKPADATYTETFDLKMLAGRNLQPSDTTREYLVNETFVKKLNLASPEDILNKQITVGGIKAPVVGVIRDFHNLGLAQSISPIAIGTRAEDYMMCALQLAPGNPAPVLEQVKRVWESNFPDHYYAQTFMDEQVGQFMETETTILRLVTTFAGIAIFIGCLGLYGLAAFMVTRKRKEVGIRKALGANISGILWLFGKEYTRLIMVAFAIAAPLAWWAMEAWLEDYAYRVSFGAGVFVLSLSATFVVAAVTVGFQSIKAALANPVKSLRSE